MTLYGHQLPAQDAPGARTVTAGAGTADEPGRHQDSSRTQLDQQRTASAAVGKGGDVGLPCHPSADSSRCETVPDQHLAACFPGPSVISGNMEEAIGSGSGELPRTEAGGEGDGSGRLLRFGPGQPVVLGVTHPTRREHHQAAVADFEEGRGVQWRRHLHSHLELARPDRGRRGDPALDDVDRRLPLSRQQRRHHHQGPETQPDRAEGSPQPGSGSNSPIGCVLLRSGPKRAPTRGAPTKNSSPDCARF